MEANLGYLAPIPIGDHCISAHQTVNYTYHKWPMKVNSTNYSNETKILRGTKCPRLIRDPYIRSFLESLPKTLLIVGIRHPILYFQSFWNMLADNNVKIIRRGMTPYDVAHENCTRNVCMKHSRFHTYLSKLGKTPLDEKEKELLSPDDRKSGLTLRDSFNVTNRIFLYELSQINEDVMWNDLSNQLDVPYIPHDIHMGDRSTKKDSGSRINICDAIYDDFRAAWMPHAYNMSKWFCNYLVPVAKDESRDDVIIANPNKFRDIVREYQKDPCNRLIRMDDGTYVLNSNLTTVADDGSAETWAEHERMR